MPWISQESFQATSEHLSRCIADGHLTSQVLSDFEPTKILRIWQCRLGNVPLLVKAEKPFDRQDDIEREYKVGLLLNRLRHRVPNFVSTIATFKSSPPSRHRLPGSSPASRDDVRYLLLERVHGDPVGQGLTLDEHLRVLVQLTQALYLAYAEHQFTHYNLHLHNVLIRPLEAEHLIEYSARCRLQTKSLAVLIDFGRSYTRETGGRKYHYKGVKDGPSWAHDLTYFLGRLLRRDHPRALDRICAFYGIQFDHANSTTRNLATIKQFHAELRHPDEFLKFIENEFGFQAHDAKGTARVPLLQPAGFEFVESTSAIAHPFAAPSFAAQDIPTLALKVQRRKYAAKAVHEIAVHHEVARLGGSCPQLVGLRECFLHDGHVCGAYEQHGAGLDDFLGEGALPPDEVQSITRQMLAALAHLHVCGYAHADVKPGNILYDSRTGEARLADLGLADRKFRQGSVRGTRDYLPPETLLGAPLGTARDLWSLGATVFELLTGAKLFDSRRAAGRHYREFIDGRHAIVVPLAASEIANRAEEQAEQYAAGAVVAEKYALLHRLGSGTFGTVWAAQRISDAVIEVSDDALRAHAGQVDATAPPETERERTDREWRRAKGAKDMLELALHHQLIQLMAGLCGPFPPALVESGRFRASYFETDGAVRFRPEIRRVSLRDRIRRRCALRGPALGVAVDFIASLLRLDPAERPTATAALEHEWLRQGHPGLQSVIPWPHGAG
jgi:serine/threonine protein kinase